MASESSVQAAIPRFDGHYNHWSMLMENFLRSNEFWSVVSSGVQEPATGTALSLAQKTELDSLKLKVLKAKNYLFRRLIAQYWKSFSAKILLNIYGIP